MEGDDRAFEIWHEREDSVRKYLLQARTVITKNSWVKEICGIQQRLALPIWRECLGSWGEARREAEPLPGCLASEHMSWQVLRSGPLSPPGQAQEKMLNSRASGALYPWLARWGPQGLRLAAQHRAGRLC